MTIEKILEHILKAIQDMSISAIGKCVKVESQDFTDTEKAQARTNIGAVSANDVKQSDWNQADTEASDYIKNKPTIPASPFVPEVIRIDNGYNNNINEVLVVSDEDFSTMRGEIAEGRPVSIRTKCRGGYILAPIIGTTSYPDEYEETYVLVAETAYGSITKVGPETLIPVEE